MNISLLLSTAFLVAVFLVYSVGTWRLYRGQAQPRPLIEYVLMAIVFGLVASSALDWLSAGHSEASQVRQVGVWVQLICASGTVGLMMLCALLSFARRRTASPTALRSH